MQTKRYVEKTYVLELNEEEASWLRGLMQNPIHVNALDEEEDEDREMRRKFFDAVEDAGRLGGR